MKSPFPLPSAMVLAFQQIFSSLRMILVIVHSPLLGQCTSFCLQALPPASPMSPAPLHVPLRLCLGRPHLRPMTLPPHQCLHSTSPLRCGPWGHLPGRSLSRSLPRHARPRRRPARPEHPPRPTSRLLCVRARPRRRPARPEHPPQPTFPYSSRRRRASTWVPTPVPGTSLHAALLPAARSFFDTSGCPAKGCCWCPSGDKLAHYGHPG
jgi:hypothetical protein